MSISNASHYEAVLEDLRAQKRKIEIAIQAIEDLVGRNVPAPAPPGRSELTDAARVALSPLPTIQPIGPQVIESVGESNSLAGFTLREAIKTVLAHGGPMPIKTIHRLVTQAGRKTSYNSVYNTLMRLKDDGFVVAADGQWRRTSASSGAHA